MAKILRTEQLSVDGDNIRLTADQGNLIINSVSGDDLTQITSTTKIGEDISSLSVRDTDFDTDVSSLAAGTSSLESMLVNVSKYGVYSLETSNLSTGAGSSVQTITLAGRAFVAKPTITATLTGSENDPIIAVMISDVSETTTTGVYQVTFQFSDELPATGETDQATNYKLNILANVNASDQDLDTIVDSVDSDRDGDGVVNELDAYPDDSSKTIASHSFDFASDSLEIESLSDSVATHPLNDDRRDADFLASGTPGSNSNPYQVILKSELVPDLRYNVVCVFFEDAISDSFGDFQVGMSYAQSHWSNQNGGVTNTEIEISELAINVTPSENGYTYSVEHSFQSNGSLIERFVIKQGDSVYFSSIPSTTIDLDPDNFTNFWGTGTLNFGTPGDLALIASVYPSSGGRAAAFSRSNYSSVSDFIESLDNTYYPGGKIDITSNNNPFYVFDNVLTLELYSSDQSTYEKDVFAIGYNIGSTNNTLALYWGDSDGNSMNSLNSSVITGVGKYLKIKST